MSTSSDQNQNFKVKLVLDQRTDNSTLLGTTAIYSTQFPDLNFIGHTGATGPAGTSSNTGATGPIGAQGDIGPTGPIGLPGSASNTGATGPIGPQGDLGPTGAGIQGEIGPTGYTGYTGPQGLQGDIGPQGIQGDIGPTGIQGIQGELGPTGPIGYTGLQGEIGPIGYTGPRGADGTNSNTGATGSTGPIGARGPTGATGTQGNQGIQGNTGPQGLQGAQGISIKGDIGPTGYTGYTGYTGPQGIQGIQGVTGYTGYTGPIGQPGSAANTGATGYTGYTGPQGDIGPTGSKGDIGPTGIFNDIITVNTSFTNGINLTDMTIPGVLHNSSTGSISSSLITNADIDAAAGIVDTKLATISTTGKVANTATSATGGNVVNAIVTRDASGNFSANNATLVGLNTVGVVHNSAGGVLSTSLIVNADITNTTITDAKLATISTAGKVNNSATTATNTNTANAIVARDASGDFVANNATLEGLNTTGIVHNSSAGVLSTSLIVNNDITDGTIADSKLATISTAGKIANTATSATGGNVINAIVTRDSSGNFSANNATLVGLSTTGVVHNSAGGVLSTSLIVNNDITNTTITDAKLATIATSGKVANTATSATGGNVINAIITRDSSGNFSANNATLVALNTTGIVHNSSGGVLSTSLIVNADITDGTITDAKLATISTSGKVANSATTATTSSTPDTIALRDSNGNIAINNLIIDTLTPAGVVHNDVDGLLSTSLIVNADIDDFAAIVDTKLATISTAGKVANSATTATTSPIGNTIVLRDGGGNGSFNRVFAKDELWLTNLTTPTFPLIVVPAATTATRHYDLLDVGRDANFIMSTGASQTIGGGLTLSSLNSSGLVHTDTNGLLSTSSIVNADITDGTITDAKLATISTSGKVSNSATTATFLNTAGAIVARDTTDPGAINVGKVRIGTTAPLAFSGEVLSINGVAGFNNDIYLKSSTGVGNTYIYIKQPAFTTSRSYSLVDVGANANFLMSTSTSGQTIGGPVTLGALNSAGVVHTSSAGLLSTSSIVNADIDASAAIADTKLATISTAGKVANSATTATPFNSFNTIVTRGTDGNISCGQIYTRPQLAATGGNYIMINVASSPAANRTYTMPDAGGNANFILSTSSSGQTVAGNVTLSSLNSAGIVHTDSSGLLSTSNIVNADITDGTITDAKLATISTAGKVANSATTATDLNTANTIMSRNSSGGTTVNRLSVFGELWKYDTSTSTVQYIIDSVDPTAIRRYNLVDVGANANFIMSTSTTGQTIGGPFTLSVAPTISTLTTAGVLHNDASGLLSSSLVVNADIDVAAAIADTKLATISTSGKVSNSATTATSANTASAIVARDNLGRVTVGATYYPIGSNGRTYAVFGGAEPAASRLYSLVDVGSDANFIMSTSAAGQTIAGALTLSSTANTGRLNANVTSGAFFSGSDNRDWSATPFTGPGFEQKGDNIAVLTIQSTNQSNDTVPIPANCQVAQLRIGGVIGNGPYNASGGQELFPTYFSFAAVNNGAAAPIPIAFLSNFLGTTTTPLLSGGNREHFTIDTNSSRNNNYSLGLRGPWLFNPNKTAAMNDPVYIMAGTTPAANRTYTMPDVGTNASFIMSASTSAQTINGYNIATGPKSYYAGTLVATGAVSPLYYTSVASVGGVTSSGGTISLNANTLYKISAHVNATIGLINTELYPVIGGTKYNSGSSFLSGGSVSFTGSTNTMAVYQTTTATTLSFSFTGASNIISGTVLVQEL
jgi:hypothetical protein